MKNKTLAQVKQIQQWLGEGHYVKITLVDKEENGFAYTFINLNEKKKSLIYTTKYDSDSMTLKWLAELLQDSEFSIEPLPRKPKLLEVGDRVKVIESQDAFDRESIGTVLGMPMCPEILNGDIGTVNKTFPQGFYEITLDSTLLHIRIPHWAVAKVIQEGEKNE